MLCKYPQIGESGKNQYRYPCGQCMNCRINRKRQWAARILMESRMHKWTSFVTLTYAPENLPAGGTLVKKHAQLWQKRLRKLCPDQNLRFYTVGEYGEKSQRPHYHSVVFGLSCLQIDKLEKSWQIIEKSTNQRKSIGFVTISEINPARAQYVAHYTTKKLTSPEKFSDGRAPEFSIMSTKPAIGLSYLEALAGTMKKKGMSTKPNLLDSGLSVSELENTQTLIFNGSIQLSGKTWPLDNFLKRKLYKLLGGQGSYPENWPKYLQTQLEKDLADERDPVTQETPWQKSTKQMARDRHFHTTYRNRRPI